MKMNLLTVFTFQNEHFVHSHNIKNFQNQIKLKNCIKIRKGMSVAETGRYIAGIEITSKLTDRLIDCLID